jgi:hypothetical protein
LPLNEFKAPSISHEKRKSLDEAFLYIAAIPDRRGMDRYSHPEVSTPRICRTSFDPIAKLDYSRHEERVVNSFIPLGKAIGL